MKLIWCCVLAAFMTVTLAAIDVEKTVKQVQSILQANQQLPRLTRDEILQLLNDIRSEEVKFSGSTESKEKISKENITYSTSFNEINSQPNILDNIVANDKDISVSVPAPAIKAEITTKTSKQIIGTELPHTMPQKIYHSTKDRVNVQENIVSTDENLPASISSSSVNNIESTTRSSKSTLMVVLPYTPRDGSSLQELYTRPPRVEVVHVSSTTPRPTTVKPTKQYPENLKDDTRLPAELINNFPDELQAFLDAHGLKGSPGQDHFLLPLEGFKPLPPPVKVIDDSIQLPEKLLLTYDLISPSSDSKTKNDKTYSLSPNNFLFAPLRPKLPFELDTSSSETKEVSIPYDMPHKVELISPNYAPIDYDSVKVIPLNKGINPNNEQVNSSNDQNKRQISNEESTSSTSTTTTTTTTEEPKTNAMAESSAADGDTGASISDLEESFGGAVPSQPGDSQLPPPRKNGFYWMLDWNSFLEVGDGDTKVNIRFEPKLGDPQMFLPVTVP